MNSTRRAGYISIGFSGTEVYTCQTSLALHTVPLPPRRIRHLEIKSAFGEREKKSTPPLTVEMPARDVSLSEGRPGAGIPDIRNGGLIEFHSPCFRLLTGGDTS